MTVSLKSVECQCQHPDGALKSCTNCQVLFTSKLVLVLLIATGTVGVVLLVKSSSSTSNTQVVGDLGKRELEVPTSTATVVQPEGPGSSSVTVSRQRFEVILVHLVVVHSGCNRFKVLNLWCAFEIRIRFTVTISWVMLNQ